MSEAAPSSSGGGASGGSSAPLPSPAQALDFLTLLQSLKVRGSAAAIVQSENRSRGSAGCNSADSSAAAALWAPTPPAQTQKRTGWVKRGVAGPESIADHMYRMGLMAMLVQGSTQYDYLRWVLCCCDGKRAGRGCGDELACVHVGI